MRISDWSSDVCSSDLLEHEHWPDLDPALGGLIPPAPNREVHASVTDGTKRRFRKKRRVEERINTFRHLTANRIGEVWSPLDHDVRALAPYKTGLFRLRVGDHLYSPPFRDGNRVVGEKPGPAGYGQDPPRIQIGEFQRASRRPPVHRQGGRQIGRASGRERGCRYV